MRWPRRCQLSTWGCLAATVGGLVAACGHDWEQWRPSGPTGSGAGGSGTGLLPFGGGGYGGVAVDGECPASHPNAPALVRAWSPERRAVCIGQTEVTRRQYEVFVEEVAASGGSVGGGYQGLAMCSWNVTGLGEPDIEPGDATGYPWPPTGLKLDYPVAAIDWCDAQAFCLHHGQRLCGAIDGGGPVAPDDFDDPSSSEWFTACSNAGLSQYPYGHGYQAGVCQCDAATIGTVEAGSLDGCRTLAGVYDLSGNVWEWENACTGLAGAGDSCRQRGGGFQTALGDLDCAADWSDRRDAHPVVVGFRCCADPLLSEPQGGAAGAGGG